jgi:transposase
VSVPSPERQQLGDLVRAREDLRQDLARARGRLRALRLRRGIGCPGPGRAGALAHRAWLARLQLPDLASQATLADDRLAIEALAQRRTLLDGVLGELAEAERWAETVARPRAFGGSDTVSAVGLVAEVGDLRRVPRARALGDCLGLVPGERSSGQRRRLGGITKAGPPSARRRLIEAAWHDRHRPSVGAALAARQAGLDPRVCAVSARAQARLDRRVVRMGQVQRRPPEVVTVACARELSGFLWEAATMASRPADSARPRGCRGARSLAKGRSVAVRWVCAATLGRRFAAGQGIPDLERPGDAALPFDRAISI